jgi:hypothetical protein
MDRSMSCFKPCFCFRPSESASVASLLGRYPPSSLRAFAAKENDGLRWRRAYADFAFPVRYVPHQIQAAAPISPISDRRFKRAR